MKKPLTLKQRREASSRINIFHIKCIKTVIKEEKKIKRRKIDLEGNGKIFFYSNVFVSLWLLIKSVTQFKCRQLTSFLCNSRLFRFVFICLQTRNFLHPNDNKKSIINKFNFFQRNFLARNSQRKMKKVCHCWFFAIGF